MRILVNSSVLQSWKWQLIGMTNFIKYIYFGMWLPGHYVVCPFGPIFFGSSLLDADRCNKIVLPIDNRPS